MSGSLRGRRSEEMIQSHTYSHGGRKYLSSPRWVVAIKVPRMKTFLEEKRMEKEKESVLSSVGEEQVGGA